MKFLTVSGSKVEHIPTNTPKHSDPMITGYRFIDVEMLSDVITFLCCPDCKNTLSVLILAGIKFGGFGGIRQNPPN